MFKIYHDCTFENPSSFNWIGLIAIFISVASIVCSFLFVFLGKRVEIVSNKFQRFCIQNLDQIITPLEEKFNNTQLRISDIRNDVSSCSTDIQLFCTSLRLIYPSIYMSEIIAYTEDFSEHIFSLDKDFFVNDNKLAFLRFKIGIYSKLYDFALKKELNPFFRLRS